MRQKLTLFPGVVVRVEGRNSLSLGVGKLVVRVQGRNSLCFQVLASRLAECEAETQDTQGILP